MLYFCADDYGISKACNNRIKKCLETGALNKVSVLPNGDIIDVKQHLLKHQPKLSLHINLVEGYPLSPPEDINLIVSEQGSFKYSFIGLFFLSLSGKRKEMQKQIYKEIKKQIYFLPQLVDSYSFTCIFSSFSARISFLSSSSISAYSSSFTLAFINS